MEHSSGEATFSEPGVLGDLGPLAELGDLGSLAEQGDLGPLAELGDLGSLAELGDLGLLAELGDRDTVAVGLLRPGCGMAVCHTCWPDDMALSCGTNKRPP